MKMRLFILLILISITTFCNAETANTTVIQNQTPITQPQHVTFDQCLKMFDINKEKLFYLTLGAINANNFIVEEIQSENGYIIFYAAKNKYLATIAGIDAQNSILKITPCNEIYFFPPGIIINMFKYVELNLNTEIK